MFCSKCGYEVREDWNVCPGCGVTLLKNKSTQQIADSQKEESNLQLQQEKRGTFFQHWFILLLIAKGIVAVYATATAINRGIPEVLYLGEWKTLIMWGVIFGLSVAWMQRDAARNAGQQIMVTFGAKKKILVIVDKIIGVISGIYDLLFCIAYIILLIGNINTMGTGSLYTWLEPVLVLNIFAVGLCVVEVIELIVEACIPTDSE